MYNPPSSSSRFTPDHGPTSFGGTLVAAHAPEFTLGNIFASASNFLFGSTLKVDDRKMSASDPAYEIQKIAVSPPEFDIRNVSGAVDFESHDKLSVIEPMETQQHTSTIQNG